MKLGDIVKNKKTGELGTVEYSSFGFSIHIWINDNGTVALGKTLGEKSSELLKYWEVVDLPEGYKVHEYGGVVRK